MTVVKDEEDGMSACVRACETNDHEEGLVVKAYQAHSDSKVLRDKLDIG
jgi:hypothetical protein